MTFSAIFVIIVGVGMIGQWTVSYATKQIPELQSEPIRIWFHIAGEMATAISLIVGGIGMLTVKPWAPTLFLVSIGMLFYTAIVSPGYFAQKGQWIWVLIFGALIVLAIIAILAVLGSVNESGTSLTHYSHYMVDTYYQDMVYPFFLRTQDGIISKAALWRR